MEFIQEIQRFVDEKDDIDSSSALISYYLPLWSDMVEKEGEIVSFNFSHQAVSQPELDIFIDSIILHNIPMESVNFSNLNLSDEDMGLVCRLLSPLNSYSPSYFCSLNLSGNNFTYKAMEHLKEVLMHCPKFMSLDLSWNGIGRYGGLCMGELIASHPTLRSLTLDHCSLDETGIISILSVILETPHCPLKALSINSPSLVTPSDNSSLYSHLAQVVASSSPLSHLSVDGWNLRSDGCSFLAQALSPDHFISSLSISNNQISIEGSHILVSAIMRFQIPIKHLTLKVCFMFHHFYQSPFLYRGTKWQMKELDHSPN